MKSLLLPIALLAFACLAQQPSAPKAIGSPAKPDLYSISGTVVNAASGQALTGAHLSLAPNADRSEQVTVLSDAGGHFSFADLPAGKYALAAKRRGFIQQALDQSDVFSTAVVVGPKLDAEHIVFRMKPAGSISGYVLDEDNESVGGAQVWLFMKSVRLGVASTHLITSNGAGDKGNYRFSGLAPGTYFLAVTAQPWYAQGQQRTFSAGQREPEPDAEHSPFDVAYPLTYYNGANDFGAATPLVVTPGSGLTANITLRAVPSAHLRLQESPNEAGRHGIIQLFHEGPGGTRMYLSVSQYGDSNGMHVGGFAPGHYEVELRHYGPKDGKTLDSGTQTIDVTGDGTFDPHAGSTGSLSGKLISGTPLSDAQQLFVQLRAGPTLTLMSAPVSADGSVSFPDVVPRSGKYEVLVVGQPDLSVEWVTATGAKASGRIVELTGSGTVELSIAIASGKQAEIGGFVLQEDRPVAGAMVLLLPDDNRLLNAFVPRDQSDTDGSFTMRQVMPGKYQALAIDDGNELEYTNPEVIRPYLAAAQSVTVPPGGKIKLQLAVQTRVH